MIDPAEALARLLALAEPVEIETLPLIDAAGRWAAEPVRARRTQPARDLSAMDGYAVRYSDLPGPWRVTATSAAGRSCSANIGPGEAARIFTGAALPRGTDTIVTQEDVCRKGDAITLIGDGPTSTGDHVRSAGSDFAKDQIIIAAGERLTPPRIALAALGGHATITVRRPIRIGIISTGDELVALGIDPGPDKLPASNAAMLAAMLAELPVMVIDLGIVPDDLNALTAAFAQAADLDVMVSTGGASIGDHDHVRSALTDAGAIIDFWKIAMRPGKPLMAGRLGKAIALGLPGNPVSAFVTATLFLKPLIAQLSGASDARPATLTATLANALPRVGARTDYVRAQGRDGKVASIDGDSGMLVPLVAATCLIVRPAGSAPALAGDDVTIIPIT